MGMLTLCTITSLTHPRKVTWANAHARTHKYNSKIANLLSIAEPNRKNLMTLVSLQDKRTHACTHTYNQTEEKKKEQRDYKIATKTDLNVSDLSPHSFTQTRQELHARSQIALAINPRLVHDSRLQVGEHALEMLQPVVVCNTKSILAKSIVRISTHMRPFDTCRRTAHAQRHATPFPPHVVLTPIREHPHMHTCTDTDTHTRVHTHTSTLILPGSSLASTSHPYRHTRTQMCAHTPLSRLSFSLAALLCCHLGPPPATGDGAGFSTSLSCSILLMGGEYCLPLGGLSEEMEPACSMCQEAHAHVHPEAELASHQLFFRLNLQTLRGPTSS